MRQLRHREVVNLAVDSQQQVGDIDKTIQVIFGNTGDIVTQIEKITHFTSKQYSNSKAIDEVLKGIEHSGKMLVQFAQES